jgi:hypothetical protein
MVCGSRVISWGFSNGSSDIQFLCALSSISRHRVLCLPLSYVIPDIVCDMSCLWVTVYISSLEVLISVHTQVLEFNGDSIHLFICKSILGMKFANSSKPTEPANRRWLIPGRKKRVQGSHTYMHPCLSSNHLME